MCEEEGGGKRQFLICGETEVVIIYIDKHRQWGSHMVGQMPGMVFENSM